MLPQKRENGCAEVEIYRRPTLSTKNFIGLICSLTYLLMMTWQYVPPLVRPQYVLVYLTMHIYLVSWVPSIHLEYIFEPNLLNVYDILSTHL